MKKIGRVGVLMGGPSAEREISLKSGQAVYQALKQHGLDVVRLDLGTRAQEQIKRSKISLAFIALHGSFGEDGRIQGILESLGIPYTGSGVMASYLCLDKIASRRIFEHHGLAVPQYIVLERKFYKQKSRDLKIELPVVVKPVSLGSSIGITFVDQKSKFNPAINTAFKYDQTVIIEQYLSGREITVGILNDRPLPVVEILPEPRFFDFQAKYEKGRTRYVVPAQLTPAQYQLAQKTARLAHRVLGCRVFSRVDMILTKPGPVILEVNSIPGLTTTSLLPMAAQAQGISFTQLCLKIIKSTLT
ncbi:D-alanine--D-alanine ligase [Candidatus Omnitrophota bacterium]